MPPENIFNVQASLKTPVESKSDQFFETTAVHLPEDNKILRLATNRLP
jgi:hypothetical protein